MLVVSSVRVTGSVAKYLFFTAAGSSTLSSDIRDNRSVHLRLGRRHNNNLSCHLGLDINSGTVHDCVFWIERERQLRCNNQQCVHCSYWYMYVVRPLDQAPVPIPHVKAVVRGSAPPSPPHDCIKTRMHTELHSSTAASLNTIAV